MILHRPIAHRETSRRIMGCARNSV
jgi:hypothetical protein